MAYPSTIDAPGGTASQGTSLLTVPDHAQDHRILGSAIIAMENKVGIGAGSAAANQILVGSGVGTSAWGSVWNLAQLGTPTITGGTINGQVVNGGTLQNGVYGTIQITGGTANNQVIGTPAITGGTANTMVLGTPTIGRINSPTSSDIDLVADTANSKVTTVSTRRQGGTATDWSVAGTSNFTESGVFIQTGFIATPLSATAYSPVFPVAFSQPPAVFITATSSSTNSTGIIRSVTTAGFTIVLPFADGGSGTFWMAIGKR